MSSSKVIVVGSGIAGLYFSLQAADFASVTIITKGALSDSNSIYAQGGIAAVLDPLDNFKQHIADTIAAGAGHNNVEIVQMVVEEAPRHIQKLITIGVDFDYKDATNTSLDLTQEGGHSHRRVVHAADSTGAAVVNGLIDAVQRHPNITICEHEQVIDLLHTTSKQVIGVETISSVSPGSQTVVRKADKVVMATGGCGQVYEITTNPSIATGDGIAICGRAGAALRDMEFMQFHPTALHHKDAPPFLLSEALRGEGAKLVDEDGHRFMDRYDQRGELAPRDIVSRAIMTEQFHGQVFLDISHKSAEFVQQRFPSIYRKLEGYGLALDKQPIPVSPAAHYLCGGVATDDTGRTTIPGLYAIGEVAATGLHGANRLASNSLLECLVFASRVAQYMQSTTVGNEDHKDSHPITQPSTVVGVSPDRILEIKKEVQKIMWQQVGVKRSIDQLQAAIVSLDVLKAELERIRQRGTTSQIEEVRNILFCATAIAQQAAARPHSLGAHHITAAS